MVDSDLVIPNVQLLRVQNIVSLSNLRKLLQRGHCSWDLHALFDDDCCVGVFNSRWYSK